MAGRARSSAFTAPSDRSSTPGTSVTRTSQGLPPQCLPTETCWYPTLTSPLLATFLVTHCSPLRMTREMVVLLPRDVEEDREVPAVAQLAMMKEDPVEEKNRFRRRGASSSAALTGTSRSTSKIARVYPPKLERGQPAATTSSAVRCRTSSRIRLAIIGWSIHLFNSQRRPFVFRRAGRPARRRSCLTPMMPMRWTAIALPRPKAR